MLRDQIERYNQRLRDFEEKQRTYRGQQERTTEQDLEVKLSFVFSKSKQTLRNERFFDEPCGPREVAL